MPVEHLALSRPFITPPSSLFSVLDCSSLWHHSVIALIYRAVRDRGEEAAPHSPLPGPAFYLHRQEFPHVNPLIIHCCNCMEIRENSHVCVSGFSRRGMNGVPWWPVTWHRKWLCSCTHAPFLLISSVIPYEKKYNNSVIWFFCFMKKCSFMSIKDTFCHQYFKLPPWGVTVSISPSIYRSWSERDGSW